MVLPLAIFYFIYLGFVLIFFLYTLFNLYHLVRFGLLGIPVIIVMFVYLAGSAAILMLSWGSIAQVDWNQSISLMPTIPIK